MAVWDLSWHYTQSFCSVFIQLVEELSQIYHLKMMLLWFQCFLHGIRESLKEYQASFGEVLIILSACWYSQSSDCQENGHLSAACGKRIGHTRWSNPNRSTENAATRDRMIFMLIIYRLRKQTNKISRRFLRHRKRVSFKLASHECVKICELMFFFCNNVTRWQIGNRKSTEQGSTIATARNPIFLIETDKTYQLIPPLGEGEEKKQHCSASKIPCAQMQSLKFNWSLETVNGISSLSPLWDLWSLPTHCT